MKKDSRERAGAKNGAGDKVEGVTIHSPGRGCQAGRGERDMGTQGHQVQTHESCPLHSGRQQACFLPFHLSLLNQDKGFSRVGKEAEGKQHEGYSSDRTDRTLAALRGSVSRH